MNNRGWLSVLRLVAITASMGLSMLYGGYCEYGNKWTSYTYQYSRGDFGSAKYMQSTAYYNKDYRTYGDYQDSVAYVKGQYADYGADTYQRGDYIKEARYGLQSI